MQRIPTRISGAYIARRRPSQRADGSTVLVRSLESEERGVLLSHEEVISAESGFTREPCYSLPRSSRSVRCLEGEIFVALVDTRLDSDTFGHWQGLYLSEGDNRTLCVPPGVACGWQVQSFQASVEHRVSRNITSRSWRAICWDDPQIGIHWPVQPVLLARNARASRRLSEIATSKLPRMQATNHPTSDRATRTIHPTIAPQPVCAATSSDIAEASTPKSFARKSATTTQPPKIVLIIGSSGQLGHDLCRHLHGQATVIGACRQPEKGSLLPVPVRVDISRPASLRQAIRQVKPTLIVNAAGLTNVDLAEANPRLAQLVNATAPAIMADEAKRLGAGIIHFCSSMVFPGHGERPWREADNPDPCNQYGRTKLLGTEAILASSAPHMVFRTGWLYSSHGDNYVRRLIDLLTYRSSLPMASDHYGTPTSTDWLARTIAGLLATADAPWCDWMAEHGGLLHAAPLGYASRIETGDQILAICRQLGLPIVLKHLQPCPLRELDAQAPIPENCRLDVSRLAMRFSLDLPRWQQELNEQVVKMLGAQNLSLRGIA